MSDSARDSHYAALDLGSNSFHLIVATQSNGRLQVVDKIKEMVRLAEGISESKSIDPVVAKRALACLTRYGQRLRSIPSQNVRVVGTNALRQAKNANDFLQQAETALGHKIEIISGQEEARLIYLGVAHAVEDHYEQRLVIDIGGGSTEIILGRRFDPLLMESLHIGCVSLSMRAFANGKLTQANFEHARALALQELEPIAEQFRNSEWGIALGASGTILAAAAVLEATAKNHEFSGDTITSAGLEYLAAAIIKQEKLEQLSLPGLSSERAAVFPGGIAILQGLFSALGIQQLKTSQGALREGLLYDLLGRMNHQDTRERTVEDLMRRYHIDSAHARRVRETAAGLLAQVANAWQLTDADQRQTLGWSALLHEIGMDISHSQYHKHGGYLLQNMDMPGFSTADQQRLAILVRAHRRKFPKEELVALAQDDARLAYLATLLRVSTLLHRSRVNALLPHIGAQGAAGSLTLALPAQWLASHPLTRLDLQQETEYLRAVDITLTVDDSGTDQTQATTRAVTQDQAARSTNKGSAKAKSPPKNTAAKKIASKAAADTHAKSKSGTHKTQSKKKPPKKGSDKKT